MKQNKKQNTLESSLEKLEDIVDTLESNKITLDDTIKLYKEGIVLIKHCESKIIEAEKQIKVLVKDNDKFIEMDIEN